MVGDRETTRDSAINAQLRHSVGYRVDAPDGYLGLVQGIPHAGRPPQPLVLVVSDRVTVHFVSLRRVVAVLPSERRIVLGPRRDAPISLKHVVPMRQAA